MGHFGKNIIGEKYYFCTQEIDLVFGRFNSAIEDKILVVIDEANAQDTYAITEGSRRKTKKVSMSRTR